MELLVFGDRGAPVLVFPTSMGRFYQWEDFGLVSHMAPRIDAGWVQLWCVDSIDGESFYNKTAAPQDRARRHLAYERYLVDEVLPAIRFANAVDQLIVAGASFGAFHALSFVTRRPGIARKAVGMSGAYDTARWLNGDRSGEAYFVNPLAFLPNLNDDRYLAPLRATESISSPGRDDANAAESKRPSASVNQNSLPAELDCRHGRRHACLYL